MRVLPVRYRGVVTPEGEARVEFQQVEGERWFPLRLRYDLRPRNESRDALGERERRVALALAASRLEDGEALRVYQRDAIAIVTPLLLAGYEIDGPLLGKLLFAVLAGMTQVPWDTAFQIVAAATPPGALSSGGDGASALPARFTLAVAVAQEAALLLDAVDRLGMEGSGAAYLAESSPLRAAVEAWWSANGYTHADLETWLDDRQFGEAWGKPPNGAFPEERGPARDSDPPATDVAARELLFLVAIEGIQRLSRGGKGCVFRALEALRPDIASQWADGADPHALLRVYFPDPDQPRHCMIIGKHTGKPIGCIFNPTPDELRHAQEGDPGCTFVPVDPAECPACRADRDVEGAKP